MITLEKILPHLLYQFSSEAELVKAIGELSAGFTTDRQNLHRYLADPRLVAAYTAFFASTNMPKLPAVLRWLPAELAESWKQFQLIDVGAGPGTFSLAWKELGGVLPPMMIETSRLMRDQAQALMKGLYGEEALFKVPTNTAPRLMLFGHSLNEMGPQQALQLVEEHRPAALLLIEPGTKEVFQQMLQLREKLIARDWKILYPCAAQTTCPWQDSTQDWCHQFVNVRHAPDVERLTQLAFRDRRHQPVIVHVFAQPSESTSSDKIRLIRKLPPSKFAYNWQVCHREGDGLVVEGAEAMLRGMDKAQRDEFAELDAGDEVRTKVIEKVGNKLRLKF